jgi:hypothetical protein
MSCGTLYLCYGVPHYVDLLLLGTCSSILRGPIEVSHQVFDPTALKHQKHSVQVRLCSWLVKASPPKVKRAVCFDECWT